MYPHGGKYSNDPYYLSPEEEQKLERENECQYCDGSGFFYSDPDLGPCNCALTGQDKFEPYDVTCAGCGKVLSCVDAIVEEGDRWECPDCWERFEAQERKQSN
jgi:DNA-directed RNA polymerase subunit RPC12/RpoP